MRLLQTVTVTKHPSELHFVPKAGLPTFRCSGVQRSGHKLCEGPEISQFKNLGESGSLCVLRVPHTTQSWCFQFQVKVVEDENWIIQYHIRQPQRDLLKRTCAPIFQTIWRALEQTLLKESQNQKVWTFVFLDLVGPGSENEFSCVPTSYSRNKVFPIFSRFWN